MKAKRLLGTFRYSRSRSVDKEYLNYFLFIFSRLRPTRARGEFIDREDRSQNLSMLPVFSLISV